MKTVRIDRKEKEKMKKVNVMKLTQAAMLMGLGLILPFVTGQIPQFGKMLLPMHIPVLLC